MDQRLTQLTDWVNQQVPCLFSDVSDQLILSTVSGDASFRRYFRARFQTPAGTQSLIAVDAPPDKENNPAFVNVARHFLAAGVVVPEVLAVDYDSGFMLLSDLGDQLLLTHLNDSTVNGYYVTAMNALIRIMHANFDDQPLPAYDGVLLQREMVLFRDWLCEVHLGLCLSDHDAHLLEQLFNALEVVALQQPQVPVHRDYHSRNLMPLPHDESTLGVIDFQDAVHGAVTYDLLSLLRDAYIEWPPQRVQLWVQQFADQLRQHSLIQVSDATYWEWFNAMGAQRHLKVAGIFARLSHRDGKHAYLQDIPLTLSYLMQEVNLLSEQHCGPYQAFGAWMRSVLLPAFILKHPDSAVRLEPYL